jgi:hypothetical protein
MTAMTARLVCKSISYDSQRQSSTVKKDSVALATVACGLSPPPMRLRRLTVAWLSQARAAEQGLHQWSAPPRLGLGRIVALHYHLFTSYQIH